MTSPCPGCGAVLPEQDGPVHPYMTSSPACYAAFTTILAAEYSDSGLINAHRLTVDTFAVQHPGDRVDRRAIQSVGMHLVRLMAQMEHDLTPMQTNEIMVRLGPHKAALQAMTPPRSYDITAADVAPFAGTDQHIAKVRAWAAAALRAWEPEQAALKTWAAPFLKDLTRW